MKDETAGAAIEEFVGLKIKIHSSSIDDNREHKKAKCINKNDVAKLVIMNRNMFGWIRNVWDIQWIRFKVKIMK